jgi:hypothetical protein
MTKDCANAFKIDCVWESDAIVAGNAAAAERVVKAKGAVPEA